MKILIDNSNLIVGGGIQVATSFINDLKECGAVHTYHVIQSFHSAKSIDKEAFPTNFLFYDLDEQHTSALLKRRKVVQRYEENIQPDVIFVVFGPSYHASRFPKVVGFAIPYLVYPTSPFFDQISIIERLRYSFLSIVKRHAFIKNSDALIFETENAKAIVANQIPKSVRTFAVSNTLNEIFLNSEKWETLGCDISSNTFNILCLSANYKHKNLQIIPEVIDLLLSKYKMNSFKFVISIPKSALNFDSFYNDYINYIDTVPLAQIPNLYNHVDIVFIPTLLEVFSATYIEAMHMEKAIVASDMLFARDICNDAAIFCSPLSAEEYASAINALRVDNVLKADLVVKGVNNLKRFGNSMDRTRKYLNILESIAEGN